MSVTYSSYYKKFKRESTFNLSKSYQGRLSPLNKEFNNDNAIMNKSNDCIKSNTKKEARKSRTNSIEDNASIKEAQFAKRKRILIEQHSFLRSRFELKNKIDIKKLYYKIERWLMVIDLFCFFADLIVVSWLYFNHFEYNKHNYCTNTFDNVQRFICLGITILVLVSLVVRYIIKQQYINCKYLLFLRVQGNNISSILI